uniref:GH27201p n=1 Tax=Drosophila melanogaster TaxID=7227 RepID=Q8SWS9_DROME|nr:GH27201p [Drosophila melanogaster]
MLFNIVRLALDNSSKRFDLLGAGGQGFCTLLNDGCQCGNNAIQHAVAGRRGKSALRTIWIKQICLLHCFLLVFKHRFDLLLLLL